MEVRDGGADWGRGCSLLRQKIDRPVYPSSGRSTPGKGVKCTGCPERVQSVDGRYYQVQYRHLTQYNKSAKVAIDARHGEYAGYSLTQRYYVMGHFSRLLRPGHTRVRVSSSDPEILTSAYGGPDQIAIVAINPHDRLRQLNIAVTGGSSPSTFQLVRTDRIVQWGTERPIPVPGAAFSVVLPAESVTTFVGATK